MKTFCLSLLLTLAFSLSAYSQSDSAVKFGVICTYDYRYSLEHRDLTVSDDCQSRPIHFLTGIAGDTVTLKDEVSFDSVVSHLASGKRLLVYVHGDNSKLSTLLKRASDVMLTYDANVLLFAWPSNDIKNGSIKNYKESKENVAGCLPNFARVMTLISDYCKQSNTQCTLIFHSLGNLFAKNYARYILSNPLAQRLNIDNIILNAACVWEYDHDIWVDILSQNINGHIYITRNENDFVLKAAETFIEGGELLGETSPRLCSKNALYVDFTDLLANKANGSESHSYFIGPILDKIPELTTKYHTMINGSMGQEQRAHSVF